MRFLKKLEHKFKRGLHSAHKFVSKGEGFMSGLHSRAGHIVGSLHRNGFIDDVDKVAADKALETGRRMVNFTGDLKSQMTLNNGKSNAGGKMKMAVQPAENTMVE
jgi:hypothetical protein